jgi:hypothetical protein
MHPISLRNGSVSQRLWSYGPRFPDYVTVTSYTVLIMYFISYMPQQIMLHYNFI